MRLSEYDNALSGSPRWLLAMLTGGEAAAEDDEEAEEEGFTLSLLALTSFFLL